MQHAILKFRTGPLWLSLVLALTLSVPAFAQGIADNTPTLSTDDLVTLVGEAVVEEAAQADERVRKAREMYEEAKRRGTRQQQTDAAGELERATERSRNANARLDEARVNAIAEKSGRSPAEIRAMRESGMGWGAIANETGVHPSVNAKGKAKAGGKAAEKGSDKGKSKEKGKEKGTGKQ